MVASQESSTKISKKPNREKDYTKITKVKEVNNSEPFFPSLDDSQKHDEKEISVFLCHNSANKYLVEKIKTQVEERLPRKEKKKIKLWLDKEKLVGGDPLTPELKSAITEAKCMVVFVGDEGLGPTQTKELRFICLRCKEGNLRVIPVILSNYKPYEMPCLPCLQGLHWIDYRKGEEDPTGKLIEAIKKPVDDKCYEGL